MITTSLEISLLILTIEFALVAIAIAFFAYRAARKAKAKTIADATELVEKITSAEASRRAALETVLKVKYQYDGDELTTTIDEFMQREKTFYNAIVSTFLYRNQKKLSDLNDELAKVVTPWMSMTPKVLGDPEETKLLVTEKEQLAAEKEQLTAELTAAKETLEQTLSEYDRAFHIEQSKKDAENGQQEKPIEDTADEHDAEETAHIEAEDTVENTETDAKETETSKNTTDENQDKSDESNVTAEESADQPN